MSTVRDVSIVERWAAEAYLVVAMPKLLKAAIEAMEMQVCPMIHLLFPIYQKP
jgi:hypothetical protein